ncbi:MAG: prepilin peptidase [Gammaproteobacteria bacterium]|nr:prepilin peptidase [Gammaproteobacteria bacterium]MCP5423734.1 prepilin peptidase [Gammaproteobacteria bacterium]MCP5459684.1 prepilin peptidase [Gammaproteobacteria bacterium]
MAALELLRSLPALFVGLAGLFGLLVGSFLNVVIHRLPIMMERGWREQCAELMGQPPETLLATPLNLWKPRSHCPQCGHMITAAENIPVISYLWQGGRCTQCKTSISLQYPFIELLSGVLTSVVAWHFGFGWPAIAACALTWALIALTVIDYKHQLLPDSITLPFLWLGLVLALFGAFTDLRSSVIGAMAGYLSLWTVYQGFRLLTGKEGMGYGDFKLLAMLGAWQGWQYLVTIVLVSSMVGAVTGLALILVGDRDRHAPLPFGPFLAAAGWIVLLWGKPLQQGYFNLVGL